MDQAKNNEQLLKDLDKMRQRVAVLENALTSQVRGEQESSDKKQPKHALIQEREVFRIIAEAAIHATDLPELCRCILTGLVETLGFDFGTLRLYNENKKILQTTATFGLSDEEVKEKILPQPLFDKHHIAALVARTKQVIFAPNVAQHEILQKYKKRLDDLNSHSLISWPIIGDRQNLLAVMQLSAYTPQEIPEGKRGFFEIVAKMCASVIERKQTEEKLKESQKRLGLAIQGTRAGLWDWNLKTGKMTYNERWAEITGHTLKELKRKENILESLAHPDDIQKSDQRTEKHLEGKTDFYECTIRMKHKEGHWVWVKDRGKVVEFDESGKPLRMAGTHVDITEQIQTEKALKREHHLAQAQAKAAATLTSTLNLDQVLDRILAEVRSVVTHDAANFMLLDGDLMRVVRWHGYEESAAKEIFSQTFQYTEFPGFQEMAESKKPIVIPDVRKYPNWVRVHEWMNSYAAAPLFIEDEVIGFLNIDNATPNSLTEEHAQPLNIFANHAAIAIKNARLYQKTQQEIAERIQVENELRKRNKNIFVTLNSIGDAVISTDIGGRVAHMNPIAENLTGWKISEAKGKPLSSVFRIINSEKREEVENPVTKVLATGEIIALGNHTALIAKDGKEYQIADSGAPIHDDDGNIIGVVLVFRDITEEHEVREELRENEYKYRALFEQMNDAIFILDLDGKHLETNKRAADMLGYTPEELRGMYPKDVTMPTEYNHMRRMFKKIHAGYKPRPYQRSFRKKDGSVLSCEVNVELVRDEEGNPIHIQSIVRDITNRIETEKQLRHQEHLATVGQLASGIAHDFRNLLSTIILYAQISQQDPMLPQNLTKNLDIIVKESNKATELIQQILDFGGRTMVQKQPVDLAVFTQEIISLLQRMIPENIKIESKIETENCIVKVDRGRIQQALTNLAINARDAMPHGGDLQFALSIMKLTADDVPPIPIMPPGEWACLSVSDTGIGMTEEVKKHLFEPFFTTKDIGEGTGLGLAQVHGIIYITHKGYIDVKTKMGHGTTFNIYLPIYKEEEERKQKERENDENLPKRSNQDRTILFVEDQENLREAGRQILENQGYQVIIMENGKEALALCQSPRWAEEKSLPIDLVITDLVMPDMGGAELIQELRKTTGHVKAVAITGYKLQSEDIEKLKAAGFIDIIQKPFKVDKFLKVIRKALEK